MTEVPLRQLARWYEKNVAATPTLAIVRRVVQGSFPQFPMTNFVLGASWQKFELVREALGDSEFELFLQCQVAAYKKADRNPRAFYVGYFVEDENNEAQKRYEAHQEQLYYSGYFSVRSELFRACFPSECRTLETYFLRWLDWQPGQPEPNWREIQLESALKNHPFWVTLTFSRDEIVAAGPEYVRLWNSGKKKIASRKLLQDRNEFTRACLEALAFQARQITPLADDFLILPGLLKDFSYPHQIAVQLLDHRQEVLSTAPVLQIQLAAQSINDHTR